MGMLLFPFLALLFWVGHFHYYVEQDWGEWTSLFFPNLLGKSLLAQMVKRLPTMWETQVRSLGWEDPLEKEMAAHSRPLQDLRPGVY